MTSVMLVNDTTDDDEKAMLGANERYFSKKSNVDLSSSQLMVHNLHHEDVTPDVGVIGKTGRWYIEAIEQWKLGIPIMISYMFQTLLPFITYLFVGHMENNASPKATEFDANFLYDYGLTRGMNLTSMELIEAATNWNMTYSDYKGEPEELAAIGLATMSANVLGWSLIVGLTGALRTFCSQCYGAGQKKLVGVYFQRGLFVTSLACFPILGLFQVSGRFLEALGVDERVADKAGTYLRYLCINLWPYAWFQCIQKYLQTQGKITPITVTAGIVAVLSIPVNYIFISRYGIKAGPFMTIFAFTFMDILLVAYILKSGVHKETWGGWTWEATRKIPQYLSIAIPGLFMTCTEWWGFEAVTLMAGRIKLPDGSPDPTALATQGVLFQSNNFLFTLPLGLSVATAVRVGNFLGMNFARRARRSTFISILMVICIMLGLALIQIVARNYWGRLFTSNILVIDKVSHIIVISCLFEVLDGIVSVGSGVLRGAGKQRFGAIVNGIAYWLVGLPLAYVLCFVFNYGLYGLWAGMCAALMTQACIMIYRFKSLKWQRECDRAQERAEKNGSQQGRDTVTSHSLDRHTTIFEESPGSIFGIKTSVDEDRPRSTSMQVEDRPYVPMEGIKSSKDRISA